MFCTRCGTELPEDSQFCRKCGQALGSTVSSTGAAAAVASTGSKRSRFASRLLAALGGLLILLVIGWFISNLKHKNATSGNSRDLTQATVPKATNPAIPIEQPPPVPSPPRSLSPQEIYQNENAGMILIETYDDEGRKRSLGSGFVVSPDGTAITNYHVIRGASRATVKLSDGTVGSVDSVAAYDPNRDLAAIRVTPSPTKVLELGDSDKVRVGDRIVAIGSPLGLQNTMSVGIVSALRNGVIQMSDPISPGSSGGAIFDDHGKVIAVAVAQIVAGQNLNFAVPINWAKPYLNGQSRRQLSDIALENTVTQNVVDGSVTIPPSQAKTWTIALNPNKMSNAEVHGDISSAGGLDGKITLVLTYNGQPIFSCRERTCAIHQPIVGPGIYYLILDNRASPIFARTVTGQISLKYVK